MAKIQIITTDMGNGCRLCSNCEYNLDNGDVFVEMPPECPKCKEKFTDYE